MLRDTKLDQELREGVDKFKEQVKKEKQQQKQSNG